MSGKNNNSIGAEVQAPEGLSETGSGTRSTDPALLPFRCFSIDLEVGIDDRRIHKLAGVRSERAVNIDYRQAGC